MPRAGLNTERVVLEAADLADEDGFGQLTLAALAERVGVKQPSLYKHIDGLDHLLREISVLAKQELGAVLAKASVGRSGPDAVRALADAYRKWVLEHPGRYAATVRAPTPDDEADQLASAEVVQVVVDVLNGFGLAGAEAIDAARSLRAALHGFVSLETAGGFGLPRQVSRSYQFLVDTLIAGLGSR